MDIDNFFPQQRYLISFNNENFEEFFSQKKINIVSYIGIKGNYLHLNNIFYKESFKLTYDKRELIVKEVKRLFNEENNPNVKTNSILKWLFNGDIFVLYSKNLFKNNLWKNIKSGYLISIKENNILKLFEKNNYKIKCYGISLNENCELLAVAYKIIGKRQKLDRFVFIFKTREHIICISPKYRSSLSDFYYYEDYSFEQKHGDNAFCIEKLDFTLVDEFVDNSLSLDTIVRKIEYTENANCIKNRIDYISNYFNPLIISVGESADMMEFMP